MSLRSLGCLLTRRFYPREICSQQAEFLPGIVSQAAFVVPAAGRSGRSLHSLRDLSAGENAFGPVVATAALLGGLGILIFKKHPGTNVTDKDTKEVRSNKPGEVTDNKPMQVQVTNMEKRDVDMEARFHKWMKRVGRVYPNHEETRRFELFKERVKLVESLNGSSFEYHPNKFADRTDREIIAGRRHSDPFSRDFEEYDEEALLRFCRELENAQGRNVHSCSKAVMQPATDP